ncbi:MFS transporter [Nocardia sp. NPDC004860]|uniref:MFS transporter n=1 Tax=Nocardia sp. NPDC004860 TaxID=3154557 RepID=UPI0033BD9C0A
MAESATVSAPARWDARQWQLLIVLSGNMILDAIEVSIVLPALPTTAAQLHLSTWTAQWLMSGFALGFAALLVPGRGLVARYGRRRVYLGAMAVFAVASVLGGTSSSIGVLIATRVVKGGAAALTAPAGLAVIAAEFRDGAPQQRAVSIYALFGAAGFTAGLLLSGALTAVDWHLVFVFPAPVAAALLLLGWRVFPDSPTGPTPQVPIALLRNRSLMLTAVGAATLNAGYICLLLVVTLQVRAGLGWSAAQTAFALLPACLPLTLSTPYAARLASRFGPTNLILGGAVAAASAELLWLMEPSVRSYLIPVLPVLVLVEFGFVLSFAALNMRATAAVTAAERASAVPLYQTAVQLGAALSLPIVVALATVSARIAAAAIAVTGLAGVGAALLAQRKVLP